MIMRDKAGGTSVELIPTTKRTNRERSRIIANIMLVLLNLDMHRALPTSLIIRVLAPGLSLTKALGVTGCLSLNHNRMMLAKLPHNTRRAVALAIYTCRTVFRAHLVDE